MNKVDLFRGAEGLISTRADGPMNFTGHEFYDAERRANRAHFLSRKMGLKASDTVVPKLYHTGRVEIVAKHNPIWGSVAADAIITDKEGLALTVTAADCPPVFLYDPYHRVIALIHAGWKPVIAGIIKNTVDKMIEQFNCAPQNIMSHIGPGICHKCFEVGPEVALKFGWQIKGDKAFLNLTNEIESRLLGSGLMRSHMSSSNECTVCTGEKYYSWRKDKSDPLNAQMAVFILR